MTTAVSTTRSAGVLLHPTSLPGPFGIGDLGPIAHEWVNILARCGQTWWQVLPLGPTGFGDSPYQCFSAFAGNPYLISPEYLVRDGLLTEDDLAPPDFPSDQVDYGRVIPYKTALLDRACENYRAAPPPALATAFEVFHEREATWLDDFALFMALKDQFQGAGWHSWDPEVVLRDPVALKTARTRLADRIERHLLCQFFFSRQWSELRDHAHRQGIKIIGDAPIFVSIDSADVWANPEQFQLDEERKPTVVAGVPPDYFSATGQLWGNPHYDWPRMKKTGYAWWIARMKTALSQVDLIRLDHFRGFEAYWEVPAGNETAEIGQWVKGPAEDLLGALQHALGGLPIIAEDLGLITPEVEQLRVAFNLPGMRILQFAFSGPDNRFLPHHYDRNTAVYTGTHDNDTTVGWYATIPEHERAFLHRYAPGVTSHEVSRDLIRLAWSSVADYALLPLQDLLALPTSARMNFPGRPANNWGWRFQGGQLTHALIDWLGEMTALYSRSRS